MHREVMIDGVVAGAVAGALSGAPSTLAALATGRDPFEASVAAGSLLLPRETRPGRLLPAAAVVHGAISLGWGVTLSIMLPQERTPAWGAAAGLLIAAFDLGVLGRHLTRIRALPTAPQVADHVAYGLVTGVVVARRRKRRELEGGALG
jgi:hypothetical protein